MDNALANPLLEESNPLANTAANDLATDRPARLSPDMTYDEFLDWYEGSGIQNQYSTYRETKGWDEWTGDSAPPYERNEAGRYVNEDGEELFYYTGPDYETEYKNGAGLNADADYMTMADIEAKYNEDTVLNKVFDSVEDYKAYIVERQDLIDQGVIMDKWEQENQLWNDPFFRRRDGRGGPNADAMSDILKAETERREGAERDANMALADKYGIEHTITDTNGNTLVWNGSGYSLRERYKEDDKWGRKLSIMAGGAIISAALGPALVAQLGPVAGKAAASAISNLATQFVKNGEVDWEQAIMSAATSYGGAKLSESLAGSGILGEVGGKITEFGDSIMSGGGNILQSALQAGGMSLVTQLVNEGELDWKDAAIAAAIGGGTAALTNFLSDIGKPEAEGEVLEEIKVTAQRKGTQVGEGLWQLDNGTVVSDTGNVLGNMDNLDLDGDGILNANDLQDIDVNHDYVDPTYEAGDSFYDKYPVPDSTTNPTAFTEEWANNRYGSLSEDQTVAAMQRDGFTDEQIDAYLEGRYDDIDALNPNIVTHAGGWVENMEQPYTLEYRDGRHYVIMDGKLKAISEDAYTDLYADLENGGDWQATMDRYGVTDGGNVFGGYDEFGRPIYNQSATVDDWITLDGTQPPVTAPIDDFVEAQPEQENPTTESNQQSADGNANNDNPTGDPNDSTAQGQGPTGGGETSEQGGDGSGGMLGGGGLPSSGGETGGSSAGGSTGTGTIGGTGDVGVGGDNSGSAENNAGTGDNNTNQGAGSGNSTDGTDNSNTTDNNVGGEGGTGEGGGQGVGTGTNVGGNTGETDGGEGSGSGVSGETGGGSTDGSSTGSGSGVDAGTNGGSNGGDNTGGSDGAGTGSGDGAGSGDGSGGGGAGGGGLGGGSGMLSGAGDRTRPTWGPLLAGHNFKARQKGQPTIGRRLFEDLFRDNQA